MAAVCLVVQLERKITKLRLLNKLNQAIRIP